MAACPKCGAAVDENAVFCPNCGANLQAEAVGAPPQAGLATYGQPAQPQQRQRPAGITIIAVLQILGGLGALGIGSLFLAVSSRVVRTGTVLALGTVLVLLGLVALFLSYGLWRGAGWAWMTTLILQIVFLVVDLVLLATGRVTGILGVIISAIIVYYLTRPHVKAYFQRQPKPSTTQS